VFPMEARAGRCWKRTAKVGEQRQEYTVLLGVGRMGRHAIRLGSGMGPGPYSREWKVRGGTFRGVKETSFAHG